MFQLCVPPPSPQAGTTKYETLKKKAMIIIKIFHDKNQKEDGQETPKYQFTVRIAPNLLWA